MIEVKSTVDLYVNLRSISLAGFVNRSARIVGLVIECNLRDVPERVAHFGYYVAITRPAVLGDGRSAHIRSSALQNHGTVFDYNLRIVCQ